MAAETIRERIISGVVARLGNVLTTKGYNLSLGGNVTRASMNTAGPWGLNVIPQTETVTQDMSVNKHAMAIRVEARAEHGEQNPSVIAEQLLGDMIEIMTAITWTVPFTSGGTYEPQIGDVVEGEIGGATAMIEAITEDSGSWAGGDLAGSFTLRRLSGTFQAETLKIAGHANTATISGPPSGSKAVTTVTSDLADGIRYVEGGPTDYPEEDDTLTGCTALFQVNYQTKAGDPYTQP